MQDIGAAATNLGTQLKHLKSCASLARLQKILGVGYLKSHQWLDKHNVRSLGDVRAAVAEGKIRLSPAQKDGVNHYQVSHSYIAMCLLCIYMPAIDRSLSL